MYDNKCLDASDMQKMIFNLWRSLKREHGGGYLYNMYLL